MAKANKGQVSPKPAATAPVANPFAALVQAPVAQAPVAQAPVPLAVATIGGRPVLLTKSLTASLNGKHAPALGAALATQTFTLGSKAYKVRAAQNVAQWAAITAILPASAAAIVAAGNAATGLPLAPGFVGYCVRRGWLAVAQATA